MDIKRNKGTDQKKTQTTTNIILLVDTVINILKTKYNIKFDNDKDENFDDDNDNDNDIDKKNLLN